MSPRADFTPLRLLVTLGPTYESLDEVRRLTNFSTGRLGTELANFLTDQGHEVVALRGHYSTHRGELRASEIKEFTTTEHLRSLLHGAARSSFDAVFHAAAVSDFAFGKVFQRNARGELAEISSGKFSTRAGTLLVELVPTPKIISELRDLFPRARLAGWKYEVDGGREEAIALGRKQIAENRTDLCVVNGPAYGEGYGIVTARGLLNHLANSDSLYPSLLRALNEAPPQH